MHVIRICREEIVLRKSPFPVSLCRNPDAAVRRGEPAGRPLCQRSTTSQPDAHEDHRIGALRHPSLRHFPTATRQSRLRVKDPGPLPRDGLHSARRHRRIQAESDYAQGGQLHSRAEAEGSRHFRVGDPWPPVDREHLRQDECAQCQLHLAHPTQ